MNGITVYACAEGRPNPGRAVGIQRPMVYLMGSYPMVDFGSIRLLVSDVLAKENEELIVLNSRGLRVDIDKFETLQVVAGEVIRWINQYQTPVHARVHHG